MNYPQTETLLRQKRRLAALLFFAFVLISGGGLLYYRHYARHMEQEKSALLASISKDKMQQILVWRADRAARVRSLLESPILSIYLRRLAEAPGDAANSDLVRRRLESFVKNNGYTGAALVDRRGKILLNAGKVPSAGCAEIKRLLKDPGVLAGPQLSEIHRDAAGAADMHVVSLAARSGAGSPVFFAAGINLAGDFFPLVQGWPTPSPSAETLLARRQQDRLLYLNDLRHQKDAALNFSLPLATEGLPAAAALRGFAGIMKGKDYRGVQVLAYGAPVPGTDWAIVSKLDEREVMADLGAPTVLLLLLVLSLMGGAAAAVYLILNLQEKEHLKDSERAREELKEKVRELAEAQRLAHIGNWTLDLAANKLYWSDEIYRIFEIDKEKFGASYEAFLNAIHPEDRDAVHKAYTDSLANKSSYNITHRLLLKDGKIKYVNEFCETLYGEDGRALRSVGTVQDVTSIRDAERELDRKNSVLNSLLENLSGGVFMVEAPSGKPLYANPAAERLLGRGVLPAASKENLAEVYKALRLPGRAPYPPEEMPILRGMRGETRSVDDMLIVRPDGTETLLEVHGTPVRDSQGVVWASLVSFQDITQRKLAEEKILGLNRKLEAKNQEMENFLYITTHDLRTPMVNIQGFSQNVLGYFQEIGKLLAAGCGGEERIKELTDKKIPEALAFVQEGAERMDALISALLKVSRAGRVELKPEKIDPEPLLRRIMDAMRFQLEEAGAEVAVTPGLPACCADPGAVSQIFGNLLDNAVKYRDPARPLRVQVTAEKKDSFIVYSVSDNGSGINSRELKNIWTVFARPLSTRRRGEGIGLTMVKRIAERSGGSITAESKEGAGSVFRVALPAA